MTASRPDPVIHISGRLLARNTVLNFIGMAVPLIVGVVTIPFVIRGLGPDRFGILSLTWIVLGYFSFFDLGLGRATTKFTAEALGRGAFDLVPNYFWTTVIFQGFLGAMGTAVLVLVTPLLSEKILKVPTALVGETKMTFFILAFSLPVVLISGSFRGVLEAGHRFDLVNLVKTPSSAVNYLLPLAGILLGFRMPGILGLLVAARGIVLVIWVLMVFRVFPFLKSRVRFKLETLKPLLAFGGWVMVSDLLSPILSGLDRFLIGSILTVTAIGYYTAPYELVSRLYIIPTSLVMALFPAFSAFEGRNDRVSAGAIFGRSVKFLLVILGTIVAVLFVFAPDIIRLWLGAEFVRNSTLAFQILLAGLFLNVLAWVPFSHLQAIGRADIPAKFHLAEVVFYVPLAWFLIRTWGIPGAAAAWSVRVSVDMVILFWASKAIGRIEARLFLGPAMVRGLGSIVLFFVCGLLLKPLPFGIPAVAVLAIGLAAFMWLSVLSADEKTWILHTARTLPHRKG